MEFFIGGLLIVVGLVVLGCFAWGFMRTME